MEKKFFENEFLLYFHRGEIIEINNRLVQRSPRHRLLMVKRCSRSITTENEQVGKIIRSIFAAKMRKNIAEKKEREKIYLRIRVGRIRYKEVGKGWRKRYERVRSSVHEIKDGCSRPGASSRSSIGRQYQRELKQS